MVAIRAGPTVGSPKPLGDKVRTHATPNFSLSQTWSQHPTLKMVFLPMSESSSVSGPNHSLEY